MFRLDKEVFLIYARGNVNGKLMVSCFVGQKVIFTFIIVNRTAQARSVVIFSSTHKHI